MRATVLRDVLPAAALLALFGASSTASARARGIVVDSCEGCHGSEASSQLAVTPDRATFNPGDAVTFTVRITWPSIRIGGVSISSDRTGILRALSAEGLALNAQQVLTHTQPKAASNGAVTFRFEWQAPTTPGTASFFVAALAGNGNNMSSGDAPAYGLFQWVFGCTGKTFFRDSDADGYGSVAFGTWLGCANTNPPAGYAAMDGDCDENDETAHPGAPEICNRKDDDCNGQIDENAPAVMLWPDQDGDGFYRYQDGTPRIGCGGVPGYAPRGGDCDDFDPTIHPGAEEICNHKDDNCEGRVDERVRPICGVGWCGRYAPTCDPATCVPGDPQPETCNSLDDDCDGEVDEDSCGPGLICLSNACVPADDPGAPEPRDAAAEAEAGAPPGGADGGGPSSGSGGAPGGGEVARGCAAACRLGGGGAMAPDGSGGGHRAAELTAVFAVSLVYLGLLRRRRTR